MPKTIVRVLRYKMDQYSNLKVDPATADGPEHVHHDLQCRGLPAKIEWNCPACPDPFLSPLMEFSNIQEARRWFNQCREWHEYDAVEHFHATDKEALKWAADHPDQPRMEPWRIPYQVQYDKIRLPYTLFIWEGCTLEHFAREPQRLRDPDAYVYASGWGSYPRYQAVRWWLEQIWEEAEEKRHAA